MRKLFRKLFNNKCILFTYTYKDNAAHVVAYFCDYEDENAFNQISQIWYQMNQENTKCIVPLYLKPIHLFEQIFFNDDWKKYLVKSKS